MKEVEAVLFDVDGTLLDTTEFVFQAYEHTFQKHRLPNKSREEIASMMGKPLEECYRHFAPDSNSDELCETHRVFQTENLHLAIPFSNASDVLRGLKEAEVKIAAITTRSKRTSTKTLELAGLTGYIDVIVSGEDVVNRKPNPEPLLKALEQLGVKPENAVMVGDTEADVKAGKNVGSKTIAVTYGFHGSKIAESEPDFVANQIAEVIPIIMIRLKETIEDK